MANLDPNILVIRRLALGDVLLATPIIKQLFEDHRGQCQIDVLTLKPDVFLNNPYVRKVYKDMAELASSYEKVINLDLAYEKKPNIHIIDAYARVSHGLGDHIKDRRIALYPSALDKDRAKYIRDHIIAGDYLVIHMRKDTWPSRNLSEVTWKNIVNCFIELTNLKIVQVGSSHEIAFAHNPRLVNLLGGTNTHELREVIAGARCYVGIDSGTLHIAASTNTPIISMFTSAHHRLRAPLDRPADVPFIAIEPRIDCYGCQEHYPPPITGVICHRGNPFDPPCRSLFDVGDIKKSIKALNL